MICEFCNKKLVTFKYIGYYDTHYGWKCGCEKLPEQEDSEIVRGAYSGCHDMKWDEEFWE